jgi:uncharacterized protein YdeI (YjbR/CyaY-like superfamily)
MITIGMNPKVNFFFNKTGRWQQEVQQLRMICLDCGLTEKLKWGNPCYVINADSSGTQESNIVLIHVFKEYCALLLFKGALLDDANGILVQQTANVQAARQIRFTSVDEIVEQEPILKTYIYNAIAIEKAGLKVELKKTADFAMAEEFQARLAADDGAALKTAFEALTPGRQKGYLLYFSQPKQSKTREARVEKSIPKILAGKGLDDV